ncbi:prephenate dehydrogenase/arogenate dehydrogenase family protein [Geobacter sp. SVR]|uniref:prephenate dehydrogenase n=1 Tax=Geobacter sp. SVR TaxID=2495594 RepID=UPI00143F02F0|nr:prephenate dehydrogenase/arogenate dehydrogenase family protein [Geobacter sp. SVR]BCS54468.1 prephenate dehydrogenase [Geobacter sp. SVR]GCF87067.1 prephenate dehydrogenase [Geobacter sp. SVR]
MSVIIERLAIVGVGLIGGSFALALREAGVVRTIVGVDRDPANLEQALALGVVDEIAASAAQGVRGTQMVFLSVPVCSIPGVLQEIAPALDPGCIVTDGGSVKAEIVAACQQLMPTGCHFVGGHPIAGTEHSGAAASFATLFKGKRCILTPTETTDRQALQAVSRLWQAAGAEVCSMEPGHHDRIFAEISHLPHAVAYALVHAVGTADVEGENVLSYTAGGFRDFTRIASSDPAMWRDIALMNRAALLASIDGFSASLAELRGRIDRGDGDGLAEFFTIAKQFRDGIL